MLAITDRVGIVYPETNHCIGEERKFTTLLIPMQVEGQHLHSMQLYEPSTLRTGKYREPRSHNEWNRGLHSDLTLLFARKPIELPA